MIERTLVYGFGFIKNGGKGTHCIKLYRWHPSLDKPSELLTSDWLEGEPNIDAGLSLLAAHLKVTRSNL